MPMIVSWPEKIKKVIVSDHICAAWDIFPTMCDISGLQKPDDLDGISLFPLITGKGKQSEHKYLYWEFPERGGQQAVRLNNWKGIRDSTRNGKMKIELFNLENDITEETDLSDKYPEIIRQIEEIMIAEHEKPEVERFNIFTRNN